MADNVTLNPGTGGASVRTLDRSGVETQVTQLDIGGADGETLVDAFNPVPVALVAGEMLGQQLSAQSIPVVLASDQANVRSVPYRLISGNGSASYITIDVGSAKAISVIPASGSGNLMGQFSNDLSNWLSNYWFQDYGTSAQPVSTIGASGSAYWTPVYGRYFRLQANAGVCIGGIGLLQSVPSNRIDVLQSTASLLNATVNVSSFGGSTYNAPTGVSSSVPNYGSGLMVVASNGIASNGNEVASGNRTTSGNSGTITDWAGGPIGAVFNLTNANGSADEVIDLVLQESQNGGNTWVDVFHFERFAHTTGTVVMPSIPVNGLRRWSWTIGGSSPAFIFSISTNRGGIQPFPLYHQFFDRTAGLLSGTLNATSGTYQIAGCKTLSAAVTIGAASTPGTYKLQGSIDNGQNWFDLSAGVAAVANSTVIINATAGFSCRHARVICSSAATGQTGTVVAISGTN